MKKGPNDYDTDEEEFDGYENDPEDHDPYVD